MLYIIATPIGHLDDITLRSLATLKKVDLILCEDTRVTRGLLHHYQIDKPLVSYHSFNEKKRVGEILDKLKEGAEIALVSDAGTPLFQDPGAVLVQACIKEGLAYTTLPGPSSILSALVLSGYSIEKFQFIGFLPKKNSAIKEALQGALDYPGLTVAFESPHRLVESLEILNQLDAKNALSVIREITKKFESVHRGTARELMEFFTLEPPRGEIVLVIPSKGKKIVQDFTHLAETLLEAGLSKKTAVSIASSYGVVDKDYLYKKSST